MPRKPKQPLDNLPATIPPVVDSSVPIVNVPSHDSRGKFAPGNKAGLGNPHNKKMLEFRSAIYNTVTRKDLVDIINKALADAKKGDKFARDFIFDRTLGKVPQAVVAEVNAGVDANVIVNQLSDFFGIKDIPIEDGEEK